MLFLGNRCWVLSEGPHSSQYRLLYVREEASVSFSSSSLPVLSHLHLQLLLLWYGLQLLYKFEIYPIIPTYNKKFAYLSQQVQGKEAWNGNTE